MEKMEILRFFAGKDVVVAKNSQQHFAKRENLQKHKKNFTEFGMFGEVFCFLFKFLLRNFVKKFKKFF